MSGRSDKRDETRVRLGRISGAFGDKGGLKILSYNEPPANILNFDHWLDEHQRRVTRTALDDGLEHGRALSTGVGATLERIDDRGRALERRGGEIAVERAALPPLGTGEYSWADLEGLLVRRPDGTELGGVDHLLATGATAVLVVHGEREILIPFVRGDVIRDVDVAAGTIVADWDPELLEE